MSILINLCLGLFVLVAVLMVLMILMQRPKSEGLGAAFGAAVTENIFGAQTTNVLVKITAWLAGIFFALTLALAILYAHRSVGESALRRELAKTQAAAQPSPSPAGAATSPSPIAATTSPSPATAQPSPAISPAPDSGAGVLPAGTEAPMASPAATLEASATPAAASPTATAKRKRKRPE
jgi:preprotein translocase subunit SecG